MPGVPRRTPQAQRGTARWIRFVSPKCTSTTNPMPLPQSKSINSWTQRKGVSHEVLKSPPMPLGKEVIFSGDFSRMTWWRWMTQKKAEDKRVGEGAGEAVSLNKNRYVCGAWKCTDSGVVVQVASRRQMTSNSAFPSFRGGVCCKDWNEQKPHLPCHPVRAGFLTWSCRCSAHWVSCSWGKKPVFYLHACTQIPCKLFFTFPGSLM